jgi:hypothetical protein
MEPLRLRRKSQHGSGHERKLDRTKAEGRRKEKP